MRQLPICLLAIPLMGCEPSAARKAPISLTPGYYVFELPDFVPTKGGDNGECVENGAEEVLPVMLLKFAFDALKDCQVQEPVRKGNYLTVAGTCAPPANVASGTMDIESNATIEADGVYGSFKVDMANVDQSTSDAKKAALLTKLARFKFVAKRIGDC